MQYTQLGNTGLRVSRLCLGTMQFGWTADERASFAVLDAFAQAGGNFLDTADVYSRWAKGNRGGESERIIGRWMRERGNRDSLVLATKVRGAMWRGSDGEGLSRSHIMRAAEESLRRMQVEAIDLYQCHSYDEKTPIEETLRAFEDLVQQGKVRHIGASNYPSPLLTAALDASTASGLPAFATLQPHHSLVHRGEYETGLAPICIERGLAVIPYSPLGAGFLTGKYERGGPRVESARAGRVAQYFTDAGWAALAAVRAVASARAVAPATVALAWQMAQPGITVPIIGANSPAQLAEQLPAVDLDLAADELAALNEASLPFLH
ncbi:MAG: aldo/keto reductase [Tepidiformaceae bacterium]